MCKKNSKRWYVFYCKSRAEKKAKEQLIEAGEEVYLPLKEEVHIWSDRKKKVVLPLFKGYIFINCLIHEVYKLVNHYHIVAPVKIGEEFAFLRDKEIELVRLIEKHGINVTAEPKSIQKGTTVKIINGHLKGHQGICTCQSSNKYVYIDIESINYQLKVKLSTAEIEILS